MDHQGSGALDHGHETSMAEAIGRPRHAWEVHYSPGYNWRVEVPRLTLPELLEKACATWASHSVIEYRGHALTYAALASLVDRLASGLFAAGFGPGKTIALLLPNTPWHTVCFFAGLKAGARLAHVSPLDAAREMKFKLSDSGADLLITTNLAGLAAAGAALLGEGHVAQVLVGEDAQFGGTTGEAVCYAAGVGNLAGLLREDLPFAWPAVRPHDVALLQYTGGTTGLPKGAMLTHANMIAAIHSYAGWRDATVPPPGMQKVIGVLPMFHVYALGIVLLLNIHDGNEILLRPRFDPAATIEDIEQRRATTLPAVPTMLISVLSVPDVAARDLSSLCMVGSGGAPLPLDVYERASALFHQPLRLGWGMTETAAVGTRVPPGVAPTPGLIGVPLPNVEMRIVALGNPHAVLGAGEVGEIAVRGPNVFSGYWNQPELSATSFADGFFLTGDIGRMDETGLITLVDRKKRMIISGGFNVYPTMIENAIYEHPDVEEAIVIGIADAYRGEAAKAFVKLRAGAETMSLEGLKLFLADRVGRHEMPVALEVRGSLPKSPVGKLLASALVEEEKKKKASLE